MPEINSVKDSATSKISKFLKDFKMEFKKIKWPTKKEVFKKSTTVIIVSLILSIIIFGLDFAFSNAYELISKKFM